MLKQRVLTGLILAPIVIALIYFSSLTIFSGLLILVLVLASWEWGKLVPMHTRVAGIGYSVLCCLWFYLRITHDSKLPISGIAILIWFYMTTMIIVYPQLKRWWAYRIVLLTIGLLFLGEFGYSLYQMKGFHWGESWLFYLLLLIWTSDVAAYFVGKKWGKHKLIPRVSPNKTIEGLLGALLSCLPVAYVGHFFVAQKSAWLPWFMLNLLVILMGVIGDLLISMFKRQVDLKDTGNILPGHGGILDRIDSLIPASLFFVFGANFFQLF